MLATLAWVPGGFTRFVFAKLLVLAIACAIAATLPPSGRLPRQLVVAMLVGTGVFVLAAVLGETPVASLVGRWPRYEGLPVLGMYAASAWLGARVVGRGAARIVHLAHAASGMALVLLAFSLLELGDSSPLGDSTLDRAGSLLGNATDQGLVAMMAAVVIASAAIDRQDWFLLSGLLAAVATVAVSGSRIALAMTLLSLLALAVARRRTSANVVAGSLGLAALTVVVAVLTPTTRDRLLSLATGEGRLTQWRLTLDLIADHPLLGVGPSGYVDAFGAYESRAWVDFTGARTMADSPHNIALQVLAAGGILLFLCLVVLVVLTVRRARHVVLEHPEAWGPAVAVGAYGLAMLANFTAAGPTCFAAFLVGAVVAVPVLADSAEARWIGPVRSALFGVATIVLLMSCIAETALNDGIEAAGRGDTDTASQELDTADRWRPLDSDISMLGAQSLAAAASAGDVDAAEAAERRARASLRRTPDAYASRVALGVALLAQQQPQPAEQELSEAVGLAPERPDAYLQRAIARLTLGDRAGAEADARRVLSIEPRSRIARRILALIAEA